MNDGSAVVVHQIGTHGATFVPIVIEHEMIDKQLTPSFKKLREGLLPIRSIKNVVFIYFLRITTFRLLFNWGNVFLRKIGRT
jgi:hypothetical protein